MQEFVVIYQKGLWTLEHFVLQEICCVNASVPLIQHKVTGNLQLIPGHLGHKQGDTLAGEPTRHKANTLTFKLYGQFRDAN